MVVCHVGGVRGSRLTLKLKAMRPVEETISRFLDHNFQTQNQQKSIVFSS